eukprot:gene5563-5618_t
MTTKIHIRRAASASAFAAVLLATAPVKADPAPISILFVGNSFTHGRYNPVLNYNAGYDSGPGAAAGAHVHDLNCLTAASCTSAEAVSAVVPTSGNVPGATLTDKLNYLAGTSGSSSKLTEPGPFGGIPGVFLQFTKDAKLNYDVSMIAISAATLNGASYNGNVANSAKIGNAQWDRVVLQEQSFTPLPTTVNVNGQTVATRGNPTGFQAGVSGLVAKIDAADTAASKAKIPVTLYESQPLASYSFTSSNPAAPIFGSSTGGVNAPYVGAAQPMQQMASDLHNAFTNAAATTTALGGSTVGVAYAGDAWITAMNIGLAVTNPYLTTNPANQISLWDTDPLQACCTTPIGYHPSKYGSYLNALVLFDQITGVDPRTLGYEQAAQDLGISSDIAAQLQFAAAITVNAGGATVPEPASMTVFAAGAAAIGFVRRRRRAK